MEEVAEIEITGKTRSTMNKVNDDNFYSPLFLPTDIRPIKYNENDWSDRDTMN